MAHADLEIKRVPTVAFSRHAPALPPTLRRTNLPPLSYKTLALIVPFILTWSPPTRCMYSNQLCSTHNRHRGCKHTTAGFIITL